MNNLITTSQPFTMSSREIAELVKSKHRSVKRSIERLMEKGVIVDSPLVNGHAQGWQTFEAGGGIVQPPLGDEKQIIDPKIFLGSSNGRGRHALSIHTFTNKPLTQSEGASL